MQNVKERKTAGCKTKRSGFRFYRADRSTSCLRRGVAPRLFPLNISPLLKASLRKHAAAAHSSTFQLAKELFMTSLRQRFIEDMQIRNLAVNTQESYIRQVSLFARHCKKSSELLGPEQIRAYQIYLTNEKKLATSSITIAISALRFLYGVTLKKELDGIQLRARCGATGIERRANWIPDVPAGGNCGGPTRLPRSGRLQVRDQIKRDCSGKCLTATDHRGTANR